jgi:hypothetical protein
MLIANVDRENPSSAALKTNKLANLPHLFDGGIVTE